MAQEVKLNIDIEGKFKTSDYSFLQNEQCTIYFRLIQNHYVSSYDDFTKLVIEFIDTNNSLNKFLVEASKSNIINFNDEKLVKISLPMNMTKISTDYVAYPKININGINKSLQEFNLNIYQKDTAEMLSVRKVIDEFNQSYADFSSLIKKDLVGKPNGVARTDANNKVLESTLPPRLKKHVEQLILNEEVHGIRLNKNGQLEYKDPENNQWKLVKNQYDPTPPHVPPVINIKDSVVTVTHAPISIISMQKWAFGEIANYEYFDTEGTPFSGSTFIVGKVGQYTLFYELEGGRKFVKVFAVTQEGLKPPHTPPEISVSKDIVTVTHSPTTKINQEKWGYGDLDIEWFNTNGQIVHGNQFTVKEAGIHTFYYVLDGGLDFVKNFDVTSNQVSPPTTPTVTLKNNIMKIIYPTDMTPVESRYMYGKFIMEDFDDGTQFGKGYPIYSNTIDLDSGKCGVNGDTEYVSIYYKYEDGFEDVYQYKVNISEVFEELSNKVFSSFINGEQVVWNNTLFTVIDKDNGMIVERELKDEVQFDTGTWNKFDPTRYGNIGYILNTTYWNTVPSDMKSKVIDGEFFAGEFLNEVSRKIKAHIGLMNDSQLILYKQIILPTLKFDLTTTGADYRRKGLWTMSSGLENTGRVMLSDGQLSSIDLSGGTSAVAYPLKYIKVDKTALFKGYRNNTEYPYVNPAILVNKGVVSVIFNKPLRYVEQKWASGSQTVDFFKDNGIIMKDSTFMVDKAEEYTVCTKLEDGSEYVEVFDVSDEQLVNYRPNIWGLAGYNLLTWEDGVPQTTRWSTGKQDISYFRGGTGGSTLENTTGLLPNQRRFFLGVPSTITIYIKDEQGREFVEIFDITSDMANPPAKPTITGAEDGTINVTFEYIEHVKIQKWEYGYQNLSYFSYAGNEFTGNSFVTQKNGEHTIYITYDNLFKETYSLKMESIPETIDMAAVGNVVQIENEDYIVIDDRMVIKSNNVGTIKFDTEAVPESKYIHYDRPSNIGYYLDKTYYANLKQNLKDSIEETDYNVAYNYNDAPQYKLYKVALITRELLSKNGNTVTNALKAHLQPNSTSRYEHWCGSTDSGDKRSTYNIKGGTLTTSTSPSSKERPFHPVFKLKSGTRVKIKK
ncbi:hypothetical protein [Lysinibacillus xylanilyticus]|uniref:hypothetical protein n=1 Tax=Lysinibacillus xylanilyticus TaxID=582475 RepID=UPI003CFD27B9